MKLRLCAPDQPLDLALIVALDRPPEAVGEQIVGLQFTEDSSAPAGAVPEDARDRQLGVVVQDRLRVNSSPKNSRLILCPSQKASVLSAG